MNEKKQTVYPARFARTQLSIDALAADLGEAATAFAHLRPAAKNLLEKSSLLRSEKLQYPIEGDSSQKGSDRRAADRYAMVDGDLRQASQNDSREPEMGTS